jgi:hypothetical protein
MMIITHHLGAMITNFEGRVGSLWDQLGTRTSDEDYGGILAGMKAKGRRPIDFISGCSTTMRQSVERVQRSAAAADFFGAGRVLFATDCPFDPEGDPIFIRETIAALDGLTLAEEERSAIYFRNALRRRRLDTLLGPR